jgi:hypothetical protein
MAFLDNSGDIILDAVLTDLGREKMATGDFSVSYFALGDDEIDYSLYNKNHASGSAYYDLEILQTPVLEAFTGTNAAINGGLLTSTATDILYMPVLKINDKGWAKSAVVPDGYNGAAANLVYLSDSSNDAIGSTTISAVLDMATTTAGYVDSLGFLNGDDFTTKYVLIEDGLNTTTYKGTAANTTSFIASTGLMNSQYYIHYDNRFIDTVYGADASSKLGMSTSAGTISVTLSAARTATFDLALDNYSTARIAGASNAIYYSPSNTADDTTISAIAGPRGNFTAFALSPKSDLGEKYSLFGNTLTINGTSCEYIDTTLFVEGVTTGATLQVPIRIVRVKV